MIGLVWTAFRRDLSKNGGMKDIHFPRIERLITAQTGLQLRPREREALGVTLAMRMEALCLRHSDEYECLLEAGTLDADREWDQLTVHLTNNESYFFRDKGQMALLRDRILPELIAENASRRRLRLWSAGCSTGEEAYSLAMLVEELLPQRGAGSGAPWEISILGSDIDSHALQEARRGIYSAWSFRTMEAALRQRWFQRHGDSWRIGEEIRSLVTFQRCNLVAEPFPSAVCGIYEMDLIVCRNVFIYFAPKAVAVVLSKFAQTLREGGCLMTGHAETLGQLVEPLVARHFPESVVCQRRSQTWAGGERQHRIAEPPLSRAPARVTESLRPPAAPRSLREPAAAQPAAAASPALPKAAIQGAADAGTLAAAEARYAVGDYLGTVRMLQPLEQVSGERALLLLAHAYANLGQAKEATACCHRLSDMFPFAAEPFELLSVIAQEQGRYDDAKLLLKQALYLAPKSPALYVELGALYDRDGDGVRARRMRTVALELLQELPAETALGFFGGSTAQEWRLHLQQRLLEGA